MKIRYCVILLSLFFISTIQAQVKSKITSVAVDPGFNVSVDELQFAKDRNGRDILKINIDLAVTDKSKKRINMNFDVNVLKNGKQIKNIKQEALKGGAITCAVTCAGNCPSIFGDGVCSGCSCDYNNWLSAGIGNSNNGDTFEVKIIPARKGMKDSNLKDNSKRIVFKPKPRKPKRKSN